MSTPSTVTALHPHNHFYPHYPEYATSTSSQRQSNLSLSRPSKLAHNYNPPASPTTRQLPPLPTHQNTQANAVKSDHPSPSTMSSAKDRKKADWHEFYKNGLPKEIIVIDDSSPEAEDQPPMKRTTSQHENKRRRTDGAHNTMPNGHHKNVKKDQQYDETNSSSTSSRERNTSALYSTAPTSLTSTSSAGHQLQRLDEAKVGQKRKRLSRPAPEEESPELEIVGQNQAWTNYVPPPKPPIKAGDVYTPVVRDVRTLPRLEQTDKY